jgi:Cu/Zn superoxide dismutase
MGRNIPVPAVKGTVPILLLLAVLVLTLGGCGGGGGTTSAKTGGEETTTSAGMASRTVDLTPSRESGVSGTATLTDTQNGVEVRLAMRGFGASSPVEHLAHIHQGGTCADDRAGNVAPVEYNLESIPAKEDGTGTSTMTLVGVTMDQLFSDPPKYIDVHKEYVGRGPPPETTDEGLPPAISCADLSSSGQ